MGTRAAIRPRQIDLNKPLLIVRDVKELDGSADGVLRAAPLGTDAVAKETEAAQVKKPAKEIPVPEIGQVESYYRDYLPLFQPPHTYIHSKGGTGYLPPDVVEYDLDNEDEDWLAQYNNGGTRLPADKFERILWKLEFGCAEATDNALQQAGASLTERTSHHALADTNYFPDGAALAWLKREVGGRDMLLNDVLQYWRQKRHRWKKPLLRRLQAPTSSNDTNPYNVFRPREKVNRPQTRRRRDNTEECLEKLRTVKENITAAQAIVAQVCRRERRKRDIMSADLQLLKLQVACRLEPNKQLHQAIQEKGLHELKTLYRYHVNEDQKRVGVDLTPSGDFLKRPFPGTRPPKKRRREEVAPFLTHILALVRPEPPPADEEMLVVVRPDVARLAAKAQGVDPPPNAAAPAATNSNRAATAAATASTSAQAGAGAAGEAGMADPFLTLPSAPISDKGTGPLDPSGYRPRVGRLGRLWLDKVDQRTLEPLVLDAAEQQQQKQQAAQQAWPQISMFTQPCVREVIERMVMASQMGNRARMAQVQAAAAQRRGMQQMQQQQQQAQQQAQQQQQQQAPGVMRFPSASGHGMHAANGTPAPFGSVISVAGSAGPPSVNAAAGPAASPSLQQAQQLQQAQHAQQLQQPLPQQPLQQQGSGGQDGAGTPRGQSPVPQGTAAGPNAAARTPAVKTEPGLQQQGSGPMQLTLKRGPGRPPKSGMKVPGQANGGTPGPE